MNQYRGFFSFDAAFALLFALIASFSFIAILSAAGDSAGASAQRQSGALAALRASEQVLFGCEKKGGEGSLSPYRHAWELDTARCRSLGLLGLRDKLGRNYISVSLRTSEGEMLFASDGAAAAETYCSPRLALLDGEISRMEVCVS